MKTIVLGSGCFWCGEAVFQHVDGVVNVVPGYAGGRVSDPTYDVVSTGKTGHAEVNKVTYDPEKVSLKQLLYIFFATHNPTTPNRQGADVGPQYRSIVLFEDPADEDTVCDVLDEVQLRLDVPVVTEVMQLHKFYEAEAEHHNFYAQNPEMAYCQIVIEPKLDKLKAFLREQQQQT